MDLARLHEGLNERGQKLKNQTVPANFSQGKCELHKLRKLDTRYVCLECGRYLKILNGILVARTAAEQADYFKRRREPLAKMLGETLGESHDHQRVT